VKKSIDLRRSALGTVLASAVFSLFLNSTSVSANPSGGGLGSNPTGNGRVIGEDSQSVEVNGVISSGNTSASANSTGSIEFAPGFLSLDSVPDLRFAPTFAGAGAVTLIDNTRGGYTGTSFTDGNSYGRLQVSDYRYSGAPFGSTTSKPLQNNGGWTLYAKLGFFSPIGGRRINGGVHTNKNYNDSGASSYGGTAPGTAPTSVGPNDWAIYLNNKAAAEDRNVANGSNFRDNVFLSAAPMSDYPYGKDVNYDRTSTLIAGGPQVKIWWTPKSRTDSLYGGFGKTTSHYDAISTASLKVGNKAENKAYYAPITWTLMAGSN
jgi:hypothetical protein